MHRTLGAPSRRRLAAGAPITLAVALLSIAAPAAPASAAVAFTGTPIAAPSGEPTS